MFIENLVDDSSVKQENIRSAGSLPALTAGQRLGSESFKRDYCIQYAYASGAMYRGIASKELVVRMAKSGLLGFLGAGGMPPEQLESDIDYIQQMLTSEETFGVNLICNFYSPDVEMQTAELLVRKDVRYIEASAFMKITPALVYFKARGVKPGATGTLESRNRIMAKLSRPEVAKVFMMPPPQKMVEVLVDQKKITEQQAQWVLRYPVADDICVEADSGGHTDQGIPSVLLPAMQSLRQHMGIDPEKIRIGLAGGIGTPQAAAAAFAMGADFVLTGSINQCTVEAGAHDLVKDLLQDMNVQDTEYAPAGDMFEIGAKVQVLKKGLFFPSRAKKLFELYNQYSSIEEIPAGIRLKLEEKYFRRSLNDVWEETKRYLHNRGKTSELERAARNPKHKMVLIFRWYFAYSSRLAFAGDKENRVDFQIHTGPALGAFNQWVKNSPMEDWRNRHADQIGKKIMEEAAEILIGRVRMLMPQ